MIAEMFENLGPPNNSITGMAYCLITSANSMEESFPNSLSLLILYKNPFSKINFRYCFVHNLSLSFK
ncbi:MAG: hypothetical protein UX35_C0002G0003 [Microgenomates group bacterium GW2011_GWA1_46_15]|nr:MAG: hypothetical protein UX00_C0013G0003 [Microgenomates group bacterium GW2011_GWB1_45_17]KKU23550.1 MAG: hypothetical protein UX36_C0004G0003 [Microgenomates group bacterium GW2011_GWC1_46_15]KKU24269.1 MAG: hypothetical protein UX35_C0002G0003 [Microgenomates group bacterium GW2011_GWA1_46_15]